MPFPGADSTLCRYVEANALRAGLVKRAQSWRWSSLAARRQAVDGGLLDQWPVDRPADWLEIVNAAVKTEELERVHVSVKRGQPLGSPAWTTRTAERLGLEFTLRERGRPKTAEK